MTVKVSPESQAVSSSQDQPPTAKPGTVSATSNTASTATSAAPDAIAPPGSTPPTPSSLEPSAARLLAVLTKIESAGLTVAGYLASLQAQRDALCVEIAEVESFANLSDKFVPRTPSGRKRRVDAGQPRKRRSKAATTTAAPTTESK